MPHGCSLCYLRPYRGVMSAVITAPEMKPPKWALQEQQSPVSNTATAVATGCKIYTLR
jgi:hypothetical protein